MKKFILIVYLLHDSSCETDGELKAEGGGVQSARVDASSTDVDDR